MRVVGEYGGLGLRAWNSSVSKLTMSGLAWFPFGQMWGYVIPADHPQAEAVECGRCLGLSNNGKENGRNYYRVKG